MRPEEKLHRAIWSTLDEIAQEKLATQDDEWILIDCHSRERKRAIQALTKCGAVKVVNSRTRSFLSALRVLQEMRGEEEEVIGYYIDTIEPRYTEVLDFYYENIGKRDQGLSVDEIVRVTNQLRVWRGSKVEQAPTTKTASADNKVPEKKIEKLGILEKPKHGLKLTVIVNDNYQTPLHFDTNKPTGGFLLKLSEGQASLLYSEHKQPFDYLNSAESQLVTKTGCAQTKILVSEAGYIQPTIEIEKITDRAFKQRSGKTPKNA